MQLVSNFCHQACECCIIEEIQTTNMIQQLNEQQVYRKEYSEEEKKN